MFHAGIYLGDGRMVNSDGSGVSIDSLTTGCATAGRSGVTGPFRKSRMRRGVGTSVSRTLCACSARVADNACASVLQYRTMMEAKARAADGLDAARALWEDAYPLRARGTWPRGLDHQPGAT